MRQVFSFRFYCAYHDRLLLLQKGGPQWFKLQEAESGEIQVQFKVSIPGEQVPQRATLNI